MSHPQTPEPQHTGWSDERVESLVGLLLRFGVIIAAFVTLVGGIPYLMTNGSHPAAYGVFRTHPGPLATVHGILTGVFALQSAAIIQLGILLLIATPVARVALSLFAFAKQHDRTYVIITMIVLGILVWSLMGSGGI